MSESIPSGSEREIALAALRKEQIEIEENTRLRILANGHFHPEFKNIEDDAGILTQRLKDFLDEKKSKNMGEIFNLALQPGYIDVIRLVELGNVDAPFQHNQLDGLKHEYIDLKNWFIEHRIIEDEMPREQSGRNIELYLSRVMPNRSIVVRNRPLISAFTATNYHNGHQVGVHFDIAKRMVFSMPEPLQQALKKRFSSDFTTKDGVLTIVGEDSLQSIERCIDAPRKYDLEAIRTSYYLTARTVPNQESD